MLGHHIGGLSSFADLRVVGSMAPFDCAHIPNCIHFFHFNVVEFLYVLLYLRLR